MELVEFNCTRGHAWRSFAETEARCPNLVAGALRCPGEAFVVGPRVDALAGWQFNWAIPERETCAAC